MGLQPLNVQSLYVQKIFGTFLFFYNNFAFKLILLDNGQNKKARQNRSHNVGMSCRITIARAHQEPYLRKSKSNVEYNFHLSLRCPVILSNYKNINPRNQPFFLLFLYFIKRQTDKTGNFEILSVKGSTVRRPPLSAVVIIYR